jgi:hypothetical protein
MFFSSFLAINAKEKWWEVYPFLVTPGYDLVTKLAPLLTVLFAKTVDDPRDDICHAPVPLVKV